MSRARLVVAVIALVLGSGTCTAVEWLDSRHAPTQVTLRLGMADGPGSASTDDAQYFASTLAEETDGAVQVDLVWEAGKEIAPPGAPVWDDSLITMLRAGKLDIALVPARAWDQVGESTFQALQAPFVIQSDGAAAAVARSDAALAMLARLSSSGLVGMALIPEGMRHVASFDAPLLEPPDFHGVPTRAPLSASTYETLRSIGLRPMDLSAEEFTSGVGTGEVGATEASFAEYPALPSAVVYTGNVTPYTQFDVLVMREASLRKLEPQDRQLVQILAHRTLDHSLASSDSDATAAWAYCQHGGAIAVAPARTVTALQLAARPIIERLERDPATAPALAAIRSVIATAPGGDPVRGCVPAAPFRPATIASPP